MSEEEQQEKAKVMQADLAKVLTQIKANGMAVVCLAVPCRVLPIGKDGIQVGNLTGFWTDVDPHTLTVMEPKAAEALKNGIMIDTTRFLDKDGPSSQAKRC